MRRDRDDKAKADEGHFLKDEAGTFAPLKVGHLIPHSLMNVSPARKLFWVFETCDLAGNSPAVVSGGGVGALFGT
jgi:hypothetical protein